MRARWLKPEFFTDKKIGALGMCAALVFEALWVVADDGGVAECEPVLLKGQVFMRWEEITVDDIRRSLDALSAQGLVRPYAIGDREFGLISGWKKHQRVHMPGKFRHPRPEQQVRESDDAEPAQGVRSDDADMRRPSPPRHLDSQMPRHPDTETPNNTSTGSRGNSVEKQQELAAFEEIWQAYPQRAGGNNKREAWYEFQARIHAGSTAVEILEGVRRYAVYCEATGKIGTEWVKQASTFMGRSRHYLEPWHIPKQSSRPNAAEESYARGKRALQDIPR